MSRSWSTWLQPRRIRSYPSPAVTTRSPGEEEPAAGGLTPREVERIWRAVERLYETGLHPAITFCLRRRGRVIIDRAIGHARGNGARLDGAPQLATPETLFNFFSGSKAVLALLVHQLVERGSIRLDDPVADFIPEFAQHGKERIRVRDLMAHRAGIPFTPPELVRIENLQRRDVVIAGLCAMRPNFEPRTRVAYHALTGGFLLAEVLRRVTGGSLRDFLDQNLRAPLGFRHLSYGVSDDEVDAVTRICETGPRPRFPASFLFERSIGAPVPEMVAIANDPRFLRSVVPAGNIIATASEIGRFFELLLRRGALDGTRVVEPPTVDRAVAEAVAPTLDRTIMMPMRYGLGFMLGMNHLSMYGPYTPRVFGHIGFSNVLAWADPERDVSVALMNNGKPLFTLDHLTWLDVMATIARTIPRG